MAQNWLIAVDDSVWASYAFNYATEFMDKKTDHLYLMHVMEEPTRVFVGYATPNLIDSMQKLEDEKARKLLVHYGHKAKDLGIQYTMMKGTDSNPGLLLCKAVKNYNVHQLVLGRRSMGGVQRFFVGSTSKYVVENAECNVIVVKQPIGPEEEHVDKKGLIAAEEEERIIREEFDAATAEEHADKKSVLDAEEAERMRRMGEEKEFSKERLDKLFSVYKFKDEINQKKK